MWLNAFFASPLIIQLKSGGSIDNRRKTAVIGGVERLRISSQSLKRSVRTSDAFKEKLHGHLAKRTRRLGEDIRQHLVEKGMAEKKALDTARKIAAVFGKIEDEKADNPSYIRQLAFISPKERETAFTLANKALAGDANRPATRFGSGKGRHRGRHRHVRPDARRQPGFQPRSSGAGRPRLHPGHQLIVLAPQRTENEAFCSRSCELDHSARGSRPFKLVTIDKGSPPSPEFPVSLI